jgi:hypothetical protein
MTTGISRCRCGSTKFSRSHGQSLQCVCGTHYTPEELARLNGPDLMIELCRHCNCSSAKVSGWWEKYVRCLRCGSRGPRVATAEQAIGAWNAQHAPLALRAVTEVREPLEILAGGSGDGPRRWDARGDLGDAEDAPVAATGT